MPFKITVKARDGSIAETHVDNSMPRSVSYFRIRFAPEERDATIVHCLRGGAVRSYSHSYNGGMATIEYVPR